MEQVGTQINSLRLSGQSIKPEHEQAAKVLLKEAQKRYPRQQLPTDSIKAYIEDWAELIAEIGQNQFMRKLKSAMRDSEFFPAVKAIKDAEPYYDAPPSKVTCQRCRKYLGWLYVEIEGVAMPEMVRCPHTDQIKFTVRKEINGNHIVQEATACDAATREGHS